MIDVWVGNKGSSSAIEINERKGLKTKATVGEELYKCMADPNLTFRDEYAVTHNWEKNFDVETKNSKRHIFPSYTIDLLY